METSVLCYQQLTRACETHRLHAVRLCSRIMHNAWPPISIHLKFQMHIKQLLCTAVLYFSYIKRKCVSVKFTFVPMCLWENRGTEYIYILTLSLELVMIFPSQVMAPTAVTSFQSGLSRWRV